MRLLQVRPHGDDDSILDLHPMLTVVTGLNREARASLLQAMAALPVGDDPGMAGTVEAHGVLLDLNVDTLGLLDLASPVDVVIRRGDVPDETNGANGDHPAAPAEPVATAPSAELEKAVASHRETKAAVEAMAASAEVVRAEYRGAVEARMALEEGLREVERHLDTQAASNLEAARRTVAQIETELGVDPGTSTLRATESLAERRVRLEAQLADFQRVLAAYDAIDTEPVIEAMHLVRQVSATGPIPSPRALALADEWISLQEHLAEVEARLEAEGGGTESASSRLESARARLAEAEEAVKPKELSSADITALEAAHDAVLAAEEKASGRLRGNRAMRALEEAREAEQAILDRLHFPTWSAYVMSAGVQGANVEGERRLLMAQQELEAAEAEWNDLANRLDDDPEFSGLLDQLEVVYAEAAEIVGDTEDIESALRAYRIDPNDPALDKDEARQQLAQALRDAGLDVDDADDIETLRDRAERWLVEVRTIAPQRLQVEVDRDRCAEELRSLDELLDRGDDEGVPSVVEIDDPRLDDARARVASCETRLSNHNKALDGLAQITTELERVRGTEQELAEQLEAKDELIEASRLLEQMALSRVQALQPQAVPAAAAPVAAPTMDVLPSLAGEGEESSDWYLLGRLSAGRKVSYAGSVPMVFDDPLVDIAPEKLPGLLSTVARMAETVQVVYLTDQRNIIEWARSLGPERAAVVRGSGFFA